MSETKHLVFGSGLIGGYLGGCLISQGLDTLLVGRERTQQAFQNGLILTDFLDNRSEIPAPRFWSADEPVKIDVLWLTVKCTAVENCIADLRTIVNPETVIVCCQNGFGSDRFVREAFPDNKVLNAVVGFNVAEQSENHLHRSTDGKLIVEYLEALESELDKANSDLLPTLSSRSFLADQWAKLQLNIANPVNALSNIPVKAMTEDPGFRRIIADLMQELLNVTQALNLDLPKVTAVPGKVIPKVMRIPNWIFKRIAQKMLAIDPTARTSMWWDLSQGRKTEIDFLNGAVVRESERLGLQAPLNRKIVALVHQVENGEAEIGFTAVQLKQALYD